MESESDDEDTRSSWFRKILQTKSTSELCLEKRSCSLSLFKHELTLKRIEFSTSQMYPVERLVDNETTGDDDDNALDVDRRHFGLAPSLPSFLRLLFSTSLNVTRFFFASSFVSVVESLFPSLLLTFLLLLLCYKLLVIIEKKSVAIR